MINVCNFQPRVDDVDFSSKWKELEEKYNIKFFDVNGKMRTVDEWLDDLYLQCPSRCLEMIEDIMLNGDELFSHLTKERSK